MEKQQSVEDEQTQTNFLTDNPPPYSVITITPSVTTVQPSAFNKPTLRGSLGDVIGPPIYTKRGNSTFAVVERYFRICAVGVVFVLRCYVLYQFLRLLGCFRDAEKFKMYKIYDAFLELLLATAGYYSAKILWTQRQDLTKLLQKQGLSIPLDASDEPSKRMIRRMMGRSGPPRTFYLLITLHCILGVGAMFLLQLTRWKVVRTKNLIVFIDAMAKSLFLNVLAIAQIYMVMPVLILTVRKLDRIQGYIFEDMQDLRKDVSFIALRNLHRRWMACSKFIDEMQRLYKAASWSIFGYLATRYSHMTCSFLWAVFVTHRLDSRYYSMSLSFLQICFDMSLFGMLVYYAGKTGQHLLRPVPILESWFLRKPTFGNLKFHVELLRLHKRINRFTQCMLFQINQVCRVLIKSYVLFLVLLVLSKYGRSLASLGRQFVGMQH